MELRHLESFVAVAEELHFSRAAERLQIAQSPLSQRIRALEADLGVRLFDRTNRSVALTDAGSAVLREARRTLDAAEGARRAAQRARDGESGTLRLAFVASAAFVALPALLRGVHADAPDMRIVLQRLNSAAQAQALVADRIDAGLSRTPPDPEQGLDHLDLGPEPLLVALPGDHRDAGARSVDLATLAEDPWILSRGSSAPSDLNRHIRLACARAGFEPTVAHEAPDLPSVLGVVAGGLGVSLVPAGIARLHAPGVTTAPLRKPDRAALPSTLVWHPDRRSAVVERLIAASRSRRGVLRPDG